MSSKLSEEDENKMRALDIEHSMSGAQISEEIFANVHLTISSDANDSFEEGNEEDNQQPEQQSACSLSNSRPKMCNCNGNTNADCFSCFLKEEINISNGLLEESEHWLNGIQSVKKHCKENIFKPHQSETDNDNETQLFNRISNQCFLDTATEKNRNTFSDCTAVSLVTNDLALLDIECSDEEMNTTNYSCNIHFNSLPDEIKLHVFSYFTKRELCRFVAPVCLSWLRLAKDPAFWTSIYKSEFIDVNSDLLIEVILTWCKHLSYLELEDRLDICYESFERVFKSCSKIQYISLKLCKQVDDEVLQCMSRHCKHLTGIDLEGCVLVNDKTFYRFIGLPLESVSVAHCSHISDEGGTFLVRNFQCLREINFDGIQWITDDFVTELVLKHRTTLEEVVLDGENITDSSIHKLSSCEKLRVLGLSFCHSLTHQSIKLVSRCTNLQVLKLRKGMNFTKESLLSYFQEMSTEQGVKFKSLNLAECTEITDECLFHLSEKCPNLEYLNLSWCWEVSDDGIAFIIDNCYRLKELHLVGLHEMYGIPFTRVAKNNPDLTFLDLSNCNKIKDEIVTNLVNSMPNLVAKDYYGDYLVNSENTRKI